MQATSANTIKENLLSAVVLLHLVELMTEHSQDDDEDQEKNGRYNLAKQKPV
jgi:hypothetical protein